MSEVSSETKASTAGRWKALTWFDQWDAVFVVSSIRLAFRLDRFAPLLSDALADGIWMVAWRSVVWIFPVLAFVIGLLAPSHWKGIHYHAFTSSMSFMIVALVGGILSGTAGVGFLTGYCISDIMTNPYLLYKINGWLWYSFWGRIEIFGIHPYLALLHYGALVVAYVLLALLIVILPQLARRMSEEMLGWMPSQRFSPPLISAALYVVGCGMLVYLWSQAAVLLIRPLDTSRGYQNITGEYHYLLQTQWGWLVMTAVLTAIARLFLENHARHSPRSYVIATFQQLLSVARDRGAFWATLPRYAQIGLRTIMIVFLLSGIINGWQDMLIAAISILVIQIVQSELYVLLPRDWGSVVIRAPIVLRFAIVLGVGFWLVRTVTVSLYYKIPQHAGTFRAELIGSLLMLLLFALLFPRVQSMGLKEGRLNQ